MSTLKVTNIQDTSGGNALTTEQLYNGACKAWVNFNGTGVVAIRASFNVSSITDNGTGDYTVNFTNALADANYSPVATSSGALTYYTLVYDMNTTAYNPARNTTFYRFNTLYSVNNLGGGAVADSTNVYVSIFR